MTTCHYHPIYRSCRDCGRDMERAQVRECIQREPTVTPPPSALQQIESIIEAVRQEARTVALRDARALVLLHAQLTHKGGLTERSDGITEVLVDFDLKFPRAPEQ